MVFLFAVTLVILGALLFALQGVFGRFPDNWEWVGIILAAIGLAMGVQPFTQSIWGRPKIEIGSSTRDSDDGTSRYLDIMLFNRPINRRLLKIVKIHRDTAEDVFALCSIENIQTRKMYIDEMVPKINTVREDNYSVSLPGSTTPASITLVMTSGNGDVIINRDEKPDIKMLPGKYCLAVTVHYGENKISKQMNFTVGTKSHELHWGI